MYAEATFISAVDSLQGTALAASTQTCSRHPKVAKCAKWWDSKVREALKDMRTARKNIVSVPSLHNATRYHVTGDKGLNTHWVHGENIEIAVNM